MTEEKRVCVACRGGEHAECDLFFAGMLAEGQDCCCEGEFTIDDVQLPASAPAPKEPAKEPALREPVNPGYIHPDAFRFRQSIGTFTDPESTGRKLVARLYPIKPGMVCEWARKKNCGGGSNPIVGCLGNPASDLHHGPDKNTLNNEKGSWGVGEAENVHLICSFCHNRWHAANDGSYEKGYDRVADQARPYLPVGDDWGPHEPVDADFDELVAEERRRAELGISKGGRSGGRGARGAGKADDVDPIGEDDVA